MFIDLYDESQNLTERVEKCCDGKSGILSGMHPMQEDRG